MPYQNFPKSIPQSKIESCVSDVMKKGHSKESAIAICYTSLVTGKERDAVLKSFKLKAAPNYRITTKSIMDAPNLRGDDMQRCLNCKYAQPIVTEDMPMPMESDMPMMQTMMETQKDMGIDLICTQYDFLTDRDWTCDGWEAIPSEMTTMKQADGHYRWFMFSSSSYEDRDHQIVSQKALEDDTARMNETGDFGSIGWWHVWVLDGKPVNFKELSLEDKLRASPWQFGKCDFSQMHGRISIESGTFDDDWIGEKFATMKGLGASREFFNPPPENGVFNHIRTFSRAILPESSASNRLTLFGVSAKEKNMNVQDKFNDLIKRLGNTPEAKEKVEGLLKGAETLDKAAQGVLTSKETTPETVTQKMARGDMESKIKSMMADNPEAAKLMEGKTMADMSDEEMQAMMEKMQGMMSGKEKETWFVSDMTPDELDSRLEKAALKVLTPAITEIGAQVVKMNEAQAVTAKEQGDKLAATIKSQQDFMTDIAARLAALEGLKPRGYRPTEDAENIVTKETVDAKKPKGDKQAEDDLAKWLEQMN